MMDMRNCYDGLLSAAAASANSAYEFAEALWEMGTCMLERTATNDDKESGSERFSSSMMLTRTFNSLTSQFNSLTSQSSSLTPQFSSLWSFLKSVISCLGDCSSSSLGFEESSNPKEEKEQSVRQEITLLKDSVRQEITLFKNDLRELNCGVREHNCDVRELNCDVRGLKVRVSIMEEEKRSEPVETHKEIEPVSQDAFKVVAEFCCGIIESLK